MGYYLPSKSYLRPKPRVNLRQKLVVTISTSMILISAGIIFTSIQFGDNKNTFANTKDEKLSQDIPMPHPLINTNIATEESQQPFTTDFPVVLAYCKTKKSTRSVEIKWSTMLEYK